MSERKAKERRKADKRKHEDEGDPLASFSDMKGSERTPRWEDDLRMYKLPAGKWAKIRIISKGYVMVRHWLRSKKGKNFPVLCSNFDPVTRRFTKKTCPVCAFRDPKTGDEIRWSKIAYVNIIPRAEQAKNKKKPSEWRHGFALPAAVMRKIAELTDLEGHEPYDPRKGYDLEILHNPAADPSAQYNVQRGEKSKLTEEEQGLDLYHFPDLVKLLPTSEIEDIMQRFGYTGADEDEVDEDEVDESDGSSDSSDDSKKSKKSKKSSKKKDESDDDESEDESEASDSSDESDKDESEASDSSDDKSDDKPAKVKKGKKKDESDDDESEDESEASDSSDDESSAASDSSESDSSDDESSDTSDSSDESSDDKSDSSDDESSDASDGSDDESDKDESDDKAKKSSKKRKSSKKDKDESDDLGIDLDLSDDEDDEKKSKKKHKK